MGQGDMRTLPTYTSPFSSREEILPLVHEYLEWDAKSQITEDKCLHAGRALLDGVAVRDNLRTVYQWKLQAFIRRFSRARAFADGIGDGIIESAVNAAREATLSDDGTIRFALQALDKIPGVGIPVASAILMAIHPKRFTVIDRQAYKTLRVSFRDPIPIQEYLNYLGFCRSEADRLGVTLRQFDQALWQDGSNAG